MAASPAVTVSVVSHGQGSLMSSIVQDLQRQVRTPLELILTLNIPEEFSAPAPGPGFSVRIIRNERPQGFGANHNAAFRQARSAFFCVLNPDIRLDADPFPVLLRLFDEPSLAVAAPLIVGPSGEPEDSARRFPTPLSLLKKAAGTSEGLDYRAAGAAIPVDWVAGMFMLFRSEAFRAVGGFDERYFLYYEDADICRRLRKAGFDVRLEPRCRATHFARRDSRRSARYLRWHLASMMRFLLTR